MIAMSALSIYTSVNSFNFFLTHIDASQPQISQTTVIASSYHGMQPPPFAMLIDQIEECIEFTVAGNLPFTAEQILNTAYNLLFNTGTFFDDHKKLNAQPDNEKPCDNSELTSYKLKLNSSYNNKLPKLQAMHLQMLTSSSTTGCCPVLPRRS